jgi:hypothetical protein
MPGFALPLTAAQLLSALQKGHGRALMHVRAVGLAEVESCVIDACLHDRVYDSEVEGDRTDWLMEIIAASGAESRIAQILIPQLDEPTDRYRDAVQRCQSACGLAQRGHPGARARLYGCLRKSPNSADLIGAAQIIALDGVDGLLHVAEYLGTLLLREPCDWIDDIALRSFDETRGDGSGRRVLDSVAVRSPAIAEYLRQLDRKDAQREKARIAAGQSPREGKLRAISAANVVHEIDTADPRRSPFWLVSWGVHAPESELHAVLESMLAQTDPGRLCKYLRVFRRRTLPTFDPRLLQFAEHADADVRRHAHRALSNYAHPDVRSLAIQRLNAGRWLEEELALLERNYRPGDATLLEPALRVLADPVVLHGLVFDLVEVFQLNQVAESANAMLFVYEESPCSCCRYKAVKILVGTHSAPDWLVEECRHDSFEETRQIAAVL